MAPVLRFAPSPTGLMHVGNLRLALVNWLFARQQDGQLVLRLDDTDTERSREEYAEGLQQDLKWLGLDWDRFERQSLRVSRYKEVVEALKQQGFIYPCYETPEELSLKRKTLLNRGLPPIYDRAALALSSNDKTALEAEGRKPHWRFRLDHKPIVWTDLTAGPMHFEGKDLSDPIVIREDGSLLYMLPSCVDDMDFGITHIVRGDDHITNSAIQSQMFVAMGAAVPQFAHLPLMLDSAGDKLSKRVGSLSVQALRTEMGLEPMALISLLARLGTSDAIEAEPQIDTLIQSFDFAHFSRNSPRFDVEELYRINAKLLHHLSFDQVRDRLGELGYSEIDEAFWQAVSPNLVKLADIGEWWRITKEPISPVVDEQGITKQAADLLPPEPWDQTTWKTFANVVKDQTGCKGKALFMPLRRALTGKDHGPELAALFPLIGRERAEARLRGQTA